MDRLWEGCFYSYRAPAELKAQTCLFHNSLPHPAQGVKAGKRWSSIGHLSRKQKQARACKKFSCRTRKQKNHRALEVVTPLRLTYSHPLILQKGKQRLRETK